MYVTAAHLPPRTPPCSTTIHWHPHSTFQKSGFYIGLQPLLSFSNHSGLTLLPPALLWVPEAKEGIEGELSSWAVANWHHSFFVCLFWFFWRPLWDRDFPLSPGSTRTWQLLRGLPPHISENRGPDGLPGSWFISPVQLSWLAFFEADH